LKLRSPSARKPNGGKKMETNKNLGKELEGLARDVSQRLGNPFDFLISSMTAYMVLGAREASKTQNPEVFSDYTEGLRYMRNGKFDDAFERFSNASSMMKDNQYTQLLMQYVSFSTENHKGYHLQKPVSSTRPNLPP
jgi:hypothetical protein